MTELEAIVLKRRLGTLCGVELVAWGVKALSAGLDSPSLRTLAGLDLAGEVRIVEATDLFGRCVAELSLELPSEEDAVKAHVREAAQEILSGSVAPQARAARLHHEVLSPLGHPGYLMAWCYVIDGMRPRYPETWSLDPSEMVHFVPFAEEAVDGAIRELAEWYLSVGAA